MKNKEKRHAQERIKAGCDISHDHRCDMEKACKEAGAPGRLIPVPREISAGCGLSWCAGIEDRDTIRKVIESIGVQEQEMHELMV